MLEIAKFAGGYLAVLAVPGPNLVAVAGMATAYGLVGAFPLCLGIGMGAGALCLAVLVVAEAAHEWRTAGNLAGVLLLLCVAAFVACLRPPGRGAAPSRKMGLVLFGTGFLNAATNPVTGAYFASQFLGPLSGQGTLLAMVPPLVIALALSFFFLVSKLLARPAIQARVDAWHAPIRLTAAAVLVFMAALLLARTLVDLGWRPSSGFLALAAALSFLISFPLLALLRRLALRAGLVRQALRADPEARGKAFRIAVASIAIFVSACILGFGQGRMVAEDDWPPTGPVQALSAVFIAGYAMGWASALLRGRVTRGARGGMRR